MSKILRSLLQWVFVLPLLFSLLACSTDDFQRTVTEKDDQALTESTTTAEAKSPRESARPDSHVEEKMASELDPAQAVQIREEFMQQVQEYFRLREEAEDQVPEVGDEATPEEIEAHQESLAAQIRTIRVDARPGSVFVPKAAKLFQQDIRSVVQGPSGKSARALISESKPGDVPLRVNYPYPDTAELSSVPPKLLQRFPELPEDLQYRFVNQHLILLDARASLIVDFMKVEALPE